MKSIVVVYPQKNTALSIASMLAQNGLYVSDICATGGTALSIAQGKTDLVIVCPLIMKDISASQLADSVPRGTDIVALSRDGTLQYADNLITIPLPADPQQLVQTVKVLAQSNSEESFARRSRNDDEYITKAKQCLMSSANMSEDEAHKYLQDTSMRTKKKMVDVAKAVIDGTIHPT